MRQATVALLLLGVVLGGCTTRLERVTPAGTVPAAIGGQNLGMQSQLQASDRPGTENPGASGQ